jgi:DNA-binding transcriptional regulator YiaG
MKIIEKMLHALSEEIEGAENYAEQYIEHKARGVMHKASRYKEMSLDELKHAEYLRDFYIIDVDAYKTVYSMSDAEVHQWEHGLKKCAEKMATIKLMLM